MGSAIYSKELYLPDSYRAYFSSENSDLPRSSRAPSCRRLVDHPDPTTGPQVGVSDESSAGISSGGSGLEKW
jgi:hypothetical protein